MRLTHSLLTSTYKRLVSAVYGVSKQDVKVGASALTHSSMDEHEPVEVKVGEDACFIVNSTCVDSGEERQVLGVADGVGGWKSEGVDSSCFSTALMSRCAHVASKQLVDLDRPVDILTRGVRETVWLNSQAYGSSTACVLSINSQTGLLHSANLGDSGYLVLRNGKVVTRSRSVIHHFNCPYQLSNPPPGFHLNTLSDSPNRASQSTFQLQGGDLLVTATDGLFCNMYDEDIATYLANVQTPDSEELTRAVTGLVEKAISLSRDEEYLSPFARDGSQALSWNYVGGKRDDITVILGTIREEVEHKQADSAYA